MKLLYILIFSVILSTGLSAQALTYYVDPLNGSDSNTGTIDKPFQSLSKSLSVLDANIGTIYLRGGLYSINVKVSLKKNGSENNYINIWAYPGEKPIIDFTGNTSDGLSISGTYYHIKGLEIMKAGHNAINISGHHNIIENCYVHENGNTGIHMGSSSNQNNPSFNLILNCDSYYNFDSPKGGNADGFSAKWNVGLGNVFRGCRANNNSDDGWDLWMCINTVTIDSCFAYRNGNDIWHTGLNGNNGNGFKLGGSYIATPHIIKNCVAFDNSGDSGKGIDENHNTAGQTVYNCTSFRNKGNNFSFEDAVVQGEHIIKNCVSFEGNVSITSGTQEKNSWSGFTVTAADFLSLDTALVSAPRDYDGKLKKSFFFRLSAGSSLIDAGVDVGIPFLDVAPDLGAFEYDGTTGVERIEKLANNFILEQNYPNPFNPQTIIEYQINDVGAQHVTPVQLKIFDVLGREVATLVNEEKPAGNYKVEFNAKTLLGTVLSSGVYLYRLTAGGYVQSKKMILMK